MAVSDALGRFASPKAVVPAAMSTALLMRRRGGAPAIAVGTCLAVVAEESLKRVVWERRPRLVTGDPWRSFPSGHSSAASAYFMGLALVAPTHRAMAVATACLGAAAVNVMRLRARAHWPNDVVVGDVLGIGAAVVAYVAVRALERRRRPAAGVRSDEQFPGGR